MDKNTGHNLGTEMIALPADHLNQVGGRTRGACGRSPKGVRFTMNLLPGYEHNKWEDHIIHMEGNFLCVLGVNREVSVCHACIRAQQWACTKPHYQRWRESSEKDHTAGSHDPMLHTNTSELSCGGSSFAQFAHRTLRSDHKCRSLCVPQPTSGLHHLQRAPG